MMAISEPSALKGNSGDNFVGNKAGCEPALLLLRTTSMIVNLTSFSHKTPCVNTKSTILR